MVNGNRMEINENTWTLLKVQEHKSKSDESEWRTNGNQMKMKLNWMNEDYLNCYENNEDERKPLKINSKLTKINDNLMKTNENPREINQNHMKSH